MTKITLKVPEVNDLSYREKLLSDPKTMEYNAGYKSPAKGYDYNTGTIEFPKEQWQNFYNSIINNSNKYFAYIIDSETNENVGYVHYSFKSKHNHYSCGILIEAIHRGKHYASEALKALIEKAFEEQNINELWYDVPEKHSTLINILKNIGFEDSNSNYNSIHFGKEEIIHSYFITKDKYESLKNDNQ